MTGSHEVRGSNPLRSIDSKRVRPPSMAAFVLSGGSGATGCQTLSVRGGGLRYALDGGKAVHCRAIRSDFQVSIDIGGHSDRGVSELSTNVLEAFAVAQE